jgi:hypothetical protein
MRLEEHGKTRNAFKILVVKLEGRKPLGNTGVDGE